MNDLYSLTLLLALIAGSAGAILAVMWSLEVALPHAVRSRARLIVPFCLLATLLPASLSMALHFTYGHDPGSTEPMNLLAFIHHHKAYWFVAILCVLMLLAIIYKFPGQRN